MTDNLVFLPPRRRARHLLWHRASYRFFLHLKRGNNNERP